jgi:DNA uptake protein ComE-like DNA-binding protein
MFLLALSTLITGLFFQSHQEKALQIELENTIGTNKSFEHTLSNVAAERDEPRLKPLPEPGMPSVKMVNSLTKEQWMTITGIGPVTSERIMALKSERGGFGRLEELLEVKGIGPSKFQKILAWLETQAAFEP